MDAIFRVDGNRVFTSPYAAGPWDPSMQHGSPPAALVAWAAEAIPTPVPMRIARVTVDLMRPVPVAPLTIETEILREGRKIQLCAVRLRAEGVVVVGATVLKIKLQANELPPEAAILPVELPGPDAIARRARGFLLEPVCDRACRCAPPAAGSACRVPARSGIASTGRSSKARRCRRRCGRWSAADFCNGTSAVLDFRQWTFLNADLTVNFARQPVGEWILLDADSGSAPMAPASRWRGWPISAAISAARSRAW